MPRNPVAVGSYWRKDSQIRKVVSVDNDIYLPTCYYLGFWAGFSDCPSYGQCSDRSLKQWGKLITEETALQLIPTLLEDERGYLESRKEMDEAIARFNIRKYDDGPLVKELERRGYSVVLNLNTEKSQPCT